MYCVFIVLWCAMLRLECAYIQSLSLNAMVSPNENKKTHNANFIGLKLNLLCQCKWKLQSLGWLICYVAACYYWYLPQNIVILMMNRNLQCWVLDLSSCHLVNEPNNIDSGFRFIFQLMRVLSLSAFYLLSLTNFLFLDLCLRLRFLFTCVSNLLIRLGRWFAVSFLCLREPNFKRSLSLRSCHSSVGCKDIVDLE